MGIITNFITTVEPSLKTLEDFFTKITDIVSLFSENGSFRKAIDWLYTAFYDIAMRIQTLLTPNMDTFFNSLGDIGQRIYDLFH